MMLPPIHLGDCWTDLQLITYCKAGYHHIVLLSDENVMKYYGEKVKAYFKAHKVLIQIIILPPGEQSKTRQTKAMLEDKLFTLGCGKDTLLIALGGGVITDITGFLASTYYRGIPVIYLPTTLLGMVDAALGGKTGINTPQGKNMIGTYYDPCALFININFLSTLPTLEYTLAFAEIIKHGLIADANYCDLLVNKVKLLQAKDHELLTTVVTHSYTLKSAIVAEDKRETAKREILNFGHTIGHALEVASAYTMPHGQAVALGIFAESELAYNMEILPSTAVIHQLLKDYGLLMPQKLPPKEKILQSLQSDKKIRNGKIRCILLQEIGKVWVNEGCYAHPIAFDLIETVVENLCNYFK